MLSSENETTEIRISIEESPQIWQIEPVSSRGGNPAAVQGISDYTTESIPITVVDLETTNRDSFQQLEGDSDGPGMQSDDSRAVGSFSEADLHSSISLSEDTHDHNHSVAVVQGVNDQNQRSVTQEAAQASHFIQTDRRPTIDSSAIDPEEISTTADASTTQDADQSHTADTSPEHTDHQSGSCDFRSVSGDSGSPTGETPPVPEILASQEQEEVRGGPSSQYTSPPVSPPPVYGAMPFTTEDLQAAVRAELARRDPCRPGDKPPSYEEVMGLPPGTQSNVPENYSTANRMQPSSESYSGMWPEMQDQLGAAQIATTALRPQEDDNANIKIRFLVFCVFMIMLVSFLGIFLGSL